MNQDRQAEIAKKRARLQELKRQREVRQSQSRGGIGGPSDVCIYSCWAVPPRFPALTDPST